jgi:hypothetical protein
MAPRRQWGEDGTTGDSELVFQICGKTTQSAAELEFRPDWIVASRGAAKVLQQ